MKKFEFNTFLVIALIVLFSVTAYAAQYILGQPTAVISASSSPVFTRNLSTGMTGNDVSALNAILDIEFNTAIQNSNTFNANTKSYLIKLQQRYGITANGSFGTTTIDKLNSLANEYGVTLANFASPASTQASAAVSTPSVPQIFTEPLSLGSVSDKVSLLKNILNSDPATALVFTTVSEQSAPANLFDTATQIAVIKFQEKYAGDILKPSGLTHGTGAVGPATMKKLNQILANLTGSQSTSVTTVKPNITSPSKTNVISGSCTTDLWSCGDWDPCKADGTQTRICQITSACQNPGANHNFTGPTSQSCIYTAPPVCPASSPQTKTFVQDLNFNGSRQGGVKFTLSGLKSIYGPGETINLSGNVSITDGGPFGIDQINMTVNGTEIVHASDNGKYGGGNSISNGSGSTSFTAPTTPGAYSIHISYWLADVYDGGLAMIDYNLYGSKGPKIQSNKTVDDENLSYTVSNCTPASQTSAPATNAKKCSSNFLGICWPILPNFFGF